MKNPLGQIGDLRPDRKISALQAWFHGIQSGDFFRMSGDI
jgi:hypothetical protein